MTTGKESNDVSGGPRILVVAATSNELAEPMGWRSLVCGVGPVEAAAATAAAIAAERPLAVLHVGIAGARRARALPAGSIVIGREARYSDLQVPPQWATNVVVAPGQLVLAVQQALLSATTVSIGTSARVGGTSDCDVEAMEGFGVLRAAQLAGVPAIEVRAISNEIEEDDRVRWHFALAFRAITDVTPALVVAVQRAVQSAARDSVPPSTLPAAPYA